MKKVSLAKKKKERNMETVMHDALHYFEKNGYDNTPVEKLCEEAMISTSTFFNYFGTKEKIVEMVMKDGLEDYRRFAEKAQAEMQDPFDAAKESLLFLCQATANYCNIVSVFHRIALQREEFRQIEDEYNELSASLIEGALEKSGRKCPLSRNAMMDVIGGCMVTPFLVLPPKEASERAKASVAELVDYISRV